MLSPGPGTVEPSDNHCDEICSTTNVPRGADPRRQSMVSVFRAAPEHFTSRHSMISPSAFVPQAASQSGWAAFQNSSQKGTHGQPEQLTDEGTAKSENERPRATAWLNSSLNAFA